MKSKATGCGSISTVIASIVLLCVISIIISNAPYMINKFLVFLSVACSSLFLQLAVFATWRKNELQAVDRRTRKLFTIYRALNRLYVPGKERGGGLISTEDCVELAIRGLEVYVHESEERLMQAARGDKIDGLETARVLKRSKKEKILEDFEEKVLYVQYLRQTKEVRSDQC